MNFIEDVSACVMEKIALNPETYAEVILRRGKQAYNKGIFRWDLPKDVMHINDIRNTAANILKDRPAEHKYRFLKHLAAGAGLNIDDYLPKHVTRPALPPPEDPTKMAAKNMASQVGQIMKPATDIFTAAKDAQESMMKMPGAGPSAVVTIKPGAPKTSIPGAEMPGFGEAKSTGASNTGSFRNGAPNKRSTGV